jgi:hypothetical protein
MDTVVVWSRLALPLISALFTGGDYARLALPSKQLTVLLCIIR